GRSVGDAMRTMRMSNGNPRSHRPLAAACPWLADGRSALCALADLEGVVSDLEIIARVIGYWFWHAKSDAEAECLGIDCAIEIIKVLTKAAARQEIKGRCAG